MDTAQVRTLTVSNLDLELPLETIDGHIERGRQARESFINLHIPASRPVEEFLHAPACTLPCLVWAEHPSWTELDRDCVLTAYLGHAVGTSLELKHCRLQ